jgi:pre-rRNA-processing protein TSR4
MKQMKITSPPIPNAFGLGNQIFGDLSSPPSVKQVKKNADHDDNVDDDHISDTESDSVSSEKSLLIAMASATVADSEWKSAPSYPTLYLSTASEYLPPQPKPRVHITDPTESDEKGSKDISWASEAYEDSLEMDHVFERFTKRVGYEGEQCVRFVIISAPFFQG